MPHNIHGYIWPVLVVFIGIISAGTTALAVDATIDLNPNLPGVTYPATVGPIGTVANFFQTGLLVGGLLAFGAIVYGAIRYSLSAGSSSGQGDAKDQITQAILGLLLLLFAFLILQFLNPGLTVLSLPKLDKLEIQANSGGGGGSGNGDSTAVCGPQEFGKCPDPKTQMCLKVNNEFKCMPINADKNSEFCKQHGNTLGPTCFYSKKHPITQECVHGTDFIECRRVNSGDEQIKKTCYEEIRCPRL